MTTPAQTERQQAQTDDFTVSLELLDGYAFRANFADDTLDPLLTDETPPLGEGRGPSPSRMLAVAVTNCLAASLVHCLRRSRVDLRGLMATASVSIGRNKAGRLRIQRIAVQLAPDIDAAHAAQLERCVGVFQDYCTVTASLREGFEIDVAVATAA